MKEGTTKKKINPKQKKQNNLYNLIKIENYINQFTNYKYMNILRIKPCSRMFCKCKKDMNKLIRDFNLPNEDNKKNIKKEIIKLKKNYKVCYGSYKVIFKNLEW